MMMIGQGLSAAWHALIRWLLNRSCGSSRRDALVSPPKKTFELEKLEPIFQPFLEILGIPYINVFRTVNQRSQSAICRRLSGIFAVFLYMRVRFLGGAREAK
jgi:hypothetical protein